MSGSQFTPDHAQELTTQHRKISAQYYALKKAAILAEHIRDAFDQLEDLQDTVTTENVLDAAAKLVAKGGDPAALAQVLSTMPQGGGAGLEVWIQHQEEQFTQQEAQLQQMLGVLQHELGVSALHQLAADGLRSPDSAPVPPPTSNLLH